MKEIKQLKSFLEQNISQKAILVTVISVQGSSYRRPGAKLLMLENGQWMGGISGGCLEADALKKAQLVLFKQTSKIITYDTSGNDPFQIGIGLGCNGIIDIHIAPIVNNIELVDIFNQILATRMELYFSFDLNNPILEPKLVSEKLENHFNEFIKPNIKLLIFGSNRDIIPLFEIVQFLGWEVVIIGNVLKIQNQLLNQHQDKFEKNTFPLVDEFTVIVSMNHEYILDLEVFKHYVDSNSKYIGLLGPKKRFQKMLDELNLKEEPKNVFAPAGLDLGSEGPEEIALSIVAEIKAVFNERNAGFLRNRNNSIYS